MAWHRPDSVPFPSVWHRFTGRRALEDGSVPSFRVQDVPLELFPQVVDFMCSYFMLDEPTCKCIDLKSDQESIEDLRRMWFSILEERCSLVCILEEPANRDTARRPSRNPIIVGVNICSVTDKYSKDKKFQIIGKKFGYVIGAVLLVNNLVDVFEKYNVDKYLAAWGLSVAKEFRGQNIGLEILKSRVPMCRALDVPLTGTVFTAIESQILAAKCGFEEVAEISYKDLAEKHNYVFENIQTIASKYMVLHIRNYDLIK